jgi:hypothetical protein
MMRDNSVARKVALLVALLSVIGIAFGCLPDDLLAANGSFADDPAFPAPTGGVALLAQGHSPVSLVAPAAASSLPAPPSLAPDAERGSIFPPPSSGLTLPQRC